MDSWLLWKSEGTAGREPTRIWSRPLRYDGLDFEGPQFELLHTDQAWEGPIIENPSMTWAGGKLLLFYSGGRWQDGSYGINWAHCAGMAMNPANVVCRTYLIGAPVRFCTVCAWSCAPP